MGPFNVREAFGDDAVLIHATGQPVLTNQWGVTLQSLQHGACYYLVRTLALILAITFFFLFFFVIIAFILLLLLFLTSIFCHFADIGRRKLNDMHAWEILDMVFFPFNSITVFFF